MYVSDVETCFICLSKENFVHHNMRFKYLINFLISFKVPAELLCFLWPNLDFLELTSRLEKILHQDLYASYFHLCLSIYMTVTWIFNRLEHKTKCYKNTTEGTEMEIIFKTWKIHCVEIGMHILVVKFHGLTLCMYKKAGNSIISQTCDCIWTKS